MATPKLHELLAVEGPLKTQAEKVRTDLAHTFAKKEHLFGQKVVTFIPTTEDGVKKVEDQRDLQTTVLRELGLMAGIWLKALDVAYQVDEANTVARADVTLEDGKTLLTGVPATALLQLEKRAEEMRELVSQIPTLDPAKGYTADPTHGLPHVYQAREHTAIRTKKTQEALVLYAATKEHPAQVKEISIDVPIGNIQTQEWSGMITPSEKAAMLDRAEQLKRAVKQARSRANSVEADVTKKLGGTLLSYVFGVTPEHVDEKPAPKK
jgi:hypothetical protein